MPRYYLHIVKGSARVLDREGSELPDWEAARQEALVSARLMMSEAVLDGFDISSRAIEVEDESGEFLLVPFAAALNTEI